MSYESAHVAGAASEKLVSAGHLCQDHPEVIGEVRRILLAEHLLGSVTIPRGLELVQDESSVRSNFTRWSLIKDLRNRVLYYRGYDNHAFRAIRLPKLDLRPEAKRLWFAIPAGRREH